MQGRRQFLEKSSVFGLGAILIPRFARASHDWPLLGQGEFQYRMVPDWGMLNPQIIRVKDCHEMVQDRKGRIILLTNDIKNNVLIFDPSGRLLGSWGHRFPGAHGLTLSEEGGEEFLYITDHNHHQVYKTTLKGEILMTLDYPRESGKYQSANDYRPTETAIGPNGDIYVADGYGEQWIIRYDAQGRYKGIFGGAGKLYLEARHGWKPDQHPKPDPKAKYKRSQLSNAHGVTLDTRGKEPELLVSSRMDNLFKRFDLDGNWLGDIPLPGAFVNRAVIHGQHVYASVLRSDRPRRDETGFVTILDEKNRVISNPAGTEAVYKGKKLKQIEQAVPCLVHPHDVCVDRDDNLYIAQWNSGRTLPIKLMRV